MKHYFKILLLLFVCLSNCLIKAQTDSTSLPTNSEKIIPALNFNNINLTDLVRSIALEYEVNVFIDESVNKKTSVALFNISVYNTLKILTHDNDLELKYNSERFTIKKKINISPVDTNKAIIDYNKKKNEISFILKNVKCKVFIEALRDSTNYNFLITSGDNNVLNGSLTNIPLLNGLKNLFNNNGLEITERDSIFYISHKMKSENGNFVTHNSISLKDNLISLNINNYPFKNLINEITYKTKTQFIHLDNLEYTISINMIDATLDELLSTLSISNDFAYKKRGELYYIGLGNNPKLNRFEVIQMNYLKAETALAQLPNAITAGAIINKSLELNALVIVANNEKLEVIKEYINQIDKPIPQVMIEAIVIDYNLDNLFELGVSAGVGDSSMANRPDKWYPGLDVTASGGKINKVLKDIGNVNLFGQNFNVGKLGKLPENFFLNLRALEEDGIANIRSRPMLATLNGHKASLKVGTIQNYVFKTRQPLQGNQLSSDILESESIQKIEAFISFDITPWVSPNGELTLEVKPEFQTPKGEFSPDKNKIPAISTRSLDATVRLKDGETIVLGGLIQDIESSTYSKFPILGDIPFIGELFTSRRKQKTKSELVVYITPRIFYGSEYGIRDIERDEE